MLGRGLKIGRLFGIPVHLDLTFFFIVPLFTFLLGNQMEVYAGLVRLDVEAAAVLEAGGRRTAYLFGFLATLGIYVSVLVHEFGHALTAKLYGVRTERVTLWLLGGVASFERMPRQPGAEAVVAIAGPITSVAVGAACWGLARVTPDVPLWQLIILALAWLNVFLAIFNMLPALPLDGGRVLRSLLALGMNYVDATRVSATVSRVLAVGLGLFAFFSGALLLVLIAVFIFLAVNAETRQSVVEELLKGVRVGDLMIRDVVTVPPHLPAGELLDKMVRSRHTGFPVVEETARGPRVVGLVRLTDLEEGFDPTLPVADVMKRQICLMPPEASAQEAFEQMGKLGFVRCVVTDADGMLIGLVTKTDLMRLIQVRTAATRAVSRPAARTADADDPYASPLDGRHA